jgi:hypothetical protein
MDAMLLMYKSLQSLLDMIGGICYIICRSLNFRAVHQVGDFAALVVLAGNRLAGNMLVTAR